MYVKIFDKYKLFEKLLPIFLSLILPEEDFGKILAKNRQEISEEGIKNILQASHSNGSPQEASSLKDIQRTTPFLSYIFASAFRF